LQRLDGQRAEAALAHAAAIDRMIKGVVDGDPWDEFRQLGLQIAAA
jgi:DNA polymerase-3 subunit delta